MGSHTSTKTAWGDLRVDYEDGYQRLTSACKACGRVTVQEIATDLNPFQAATPDHNAGCPIGAGRSLRLVRPDTVTVKPQVLPWAVPLWVYALALTVLIVLALLVGHSL